MVALFVAMMFIGFILVDAVVQRLETRRALTASAGKDHVGASALRETLSDWVAVPEGVHLSEGHTWARPLQAGTVRVGADSLVTRALGAVTRVFLPRAGDLVEAGEPLFYLVLDDRTLSMASPVAGRISSVNGNLRDRPGLAVMDPYGKGWVCSIDRGEPAPLPTTWRLGQRAALWLEKEVGRLQEFVSFRISPDSALGATSQDGGLPVPGILVRLGAQDWAAFERGFLHK